MRIIVVLMSLSIIFMFFQVMKATNLAKEYKSIAQEAINEASKCIDVANECSYQLDACVEHTPVEWQPQAELI